MSCLTLFYSYVWTPDAQNLCTVNATEEQEVKKWQTMKISFRNAKKPNPLFKNWHRSLLITSDSRNSLWSQLLCQSWVDCAINVVKSEAGWPLIKRIKICGSVLFYGTKTDSSIRCMLNMSFKKEFCFFNKTLAQSFYQGNNDMHSFCKIKVWNTI